jgi:hypothetical protein
VVSGWSVFGYTPGIRKPLSHRILMTAERRRFAVTPFVAVLGLLAAALSASADELAGGPTVAQLLASCERGRLAGDVGVDAALCEWYAVPCDCAGKRPVAQARWCMPDDEPIEAALPRVLAALRREPRQQVAAVTVVPEIMARLYPCAPGAKTLP